MQHAVFESRSLTFTGLAQAALLLGLATAALESRAATEFVCMWTNNAAGSWSATNPNNLVGNTYPGWSDVTGDIVADIADDLDLLDGVNYTARFAPMTGRTIVLDSNRTVGRFWYNWNGSSGSTAGGSMTISSGVGSALTLAREGGTPQVHIGYRFAANTTYGVTINAPLAGTQGFTIGQPSGQYSGNGLTLGGAGTISGPITGFSLLTLANVQAVEFARPVIAGAATLRLRNDTDGATFLTGAIAQDTSSTSAGCTIHVDRTTASGGSGHVLKLAGSFTVGGQDRIKTLTVTGGNGYSLELTGAYTNTFAAKASRIDAASANVKLSGPSVNLGGGLVLGGSLATGVSEVAGVIGGAGGVTKADASTWALSGASTYTGPTAVNGGALLVVDGGSIGTPAATGDGVTVAAAATLGGTGTIYADVALATNAIVSPGLVDAAGSLIGTLTVGDAAQAASITLGDDAVLAVDVDGTASDLLVVKGSAALGASPADEILVAVRELSAPADSQGFKVLAADGGITIVGQLSVFGSGALTRYALAGAGTELWILPTPAVGTVILLR